MTPKEKARELISKFQHPPSALEHTECDCLHIDIAKECALIAVNYIISANPHSNPLNTDVYSTMDYWQQIKQEIEKL